MTIQYHDDDLLAVDQFVRPPKGARTPDNLTLIPLSRTAWLLGVKKGLFPPPIRFGARRVYWRVGDLRRIRDQGIAQNDAA